MCQLGSSTCLCVKCTSGLDAQMFAHWERASLQRSKLHFRCCTACHTGHRETHLFVQQISSTSGLVWTLVSFLHLRLIFAVKHIVRHLYGTSAPQDCFQGQLRPVDLTGCLLGWTQNEACASKMQMRHLNLRPQQRRRRWCYVGGSVKHGLCCDGLRHDRHAAKQRFEMVVM